MAQVTCHLIGCDCVITVTGDGASFSQMEGQGEGRKRVFFCSIEHVKAHNAGNEPKRPGINSAPAPQGIGGSLV